jgi:Matrixin
MRSLAFAWGALALATALLGTARASAFCRSSVCPGGVEGKVCTPAEPDDCGKPLYWSQPCIGFDVQKSASNQVDYDLADQILRTSLGAWESAACAGGNPSIKVADLGRVDCTSIEYNQHAGNANILIFRDAKWPHTDDNTTDTIALTTVTYDTDNGEIFDADIEVNTANFTFSTDEMGSATDLQSVLTHESGHFLGLAHSTVADATMYAFYSGGTSLRTLSSDDVAAICDIYPPGRKTEGKCDYLPRHGFAPECAAEQREGDCALGAREPATGFGLVVLTLLGLAARRRAAR